MSSSLEEYGLDIFCFVVVYLFVCSYFCLVLYFNYLAYH